MMGMCSVCGGCEFSYKTVLWDDLINEWKLSSHEVEYINRQQGQFCTKCGANLRSIALAQAILDTYHYSGVLSQFVGSKTASKLRVLEINEAGTLSSVLSQMPGHRLATYPSCDMMSMGFADSCWDLVLHSDTLEHVRDPRKALSECRRILADDGRCIFTIPLIVDRMSRSRIGLSESYHNSPECRSEDILVRTEFGADFWKYIMEAGFSKCRVHAWDYPAALAIEASS